jgi:hypothetical protein
MELDSEYYISVANCRAVVCRKRVLGTTVVLEPVSNWQELENEAWRAVRSMGGAMNISAVYPAPPELFRMMCAHGNDARTCEQCFEFLRSMQRARSR